jgi:predicted XRE-type DNA-binding protein
VRYDDPVPALKRQAGIELARLVDNWKPDDIAYVLGTDRFRVAELRRGKLDRFSLETLVRYLVRGGREVELRITAPARQLDRSRGAVEKLGSEGGDVA